MSVESKPPQPGEPCPNGCTYGIGTINEQPALVEEACPGSGDGEIVCLYCSDWWNLLAEDRQ